MPPRAVFSLCQGPPRRVQGLRASRALRAPLTRRVPPCNRVHAAARRFTLFSGVFPVLLASFGRGHCSFRFYFRWQGGLGSVLFRFRFRAEAARFLLRFRAARAWWRSSAASPRSVVAGRVVPRFGLRWLACRPCLLVVAHSLGCRCAVACGLCSSGSRFCGGVRRPRRFRLPSARFRRPFVPFFRL